MQSYVPGEHVWVDATYFDDPKQPLESRYSASLDGKKQILGVIRYATSTSYSINFTDGSTSIVVKSHVNLEPKLTKKHVESIADTVIEQSSDVVDGQDSDESSDQNWVPEVPDLDSDSDDDNIQTNLELNV